MQPNPNEPVWSDWIEPANLVSLVRNTAPFLLDGTPPAPRPRLSTFASSPLGFLSILNRAEQHAWNELPGDDKLEDYFALCLACHHATVATFVPTDVDSKIRGLIWRRARDPELVRRLAVIALGMKQWDLDGVTTRKAEIGAFGPVSGHDGEWLSVMAGAHGRLLQCADSEWAERTASAIDSELHRELDAFELALATPGREIETLQMAMLIAHNIGDLDQGISFWDTRDFTSASRERFARLGHENTSAYGGRFRAPAELYRKSISAEGHRHYPLRSVKPLRQSADLLLPLGPFFDDWGAMIANHPLLKTADRCEILDALVRGCRKVANQQGYFRAIAGFQNASQRNFEAAAALLPSATRRDLREPALRQKVALPRASFESPLKKLAVTLRESGASFK